jgi:adenosylcobinamide-phosphate synthase
MSATVHGGNGVAIAEAGVAAALGLRSGGDSRHGDRVELRPTLGDGRPPELIDIARAIRLSQHVTPARADLLAAKGASRRSEVAPAHGMACRSQSAFPRPPVVRP